MVTGTCPGPRARCARAPSTSSAAPPPSAVRVAHCCVVLGAAGLHGGRPVGVIGRSGPLLTRPLPNRPIIALRLRPACPCCPDSSVIGVLPACGRCLVPLCRGRPWAAFNALGAGAPCPPRGGAQPRGSVVAGPTLHQPIDVRDGPATPDVCGRRASLQSEGRWGTATLDTDCSPPCPTECSLRPVGASTSGLVARTPHNTGTTAYGPRRRVSDGVLRASAARRGRCSQVRCGVSASAPSPNRVPHTQCPHLLMAADRPPLTPCCVAWCMIGRTDVRSCPPHRRGG